MKNDSLVRAPLHGRILMSKKYCFTLQFYINCLPYLLSPPHRQVEVLIGLLGIYSKLFQKIVHLKVMKQVTQLARDSFIYLALMKS